MAQKSADQTEEQTTRFCQWCGKAVMPEHHVLRRVRPPLTDDGQPTATHDAPRPSPDPPTPSQGYRYDPADAPASTSGHSIKRCSAGWLHHTGARIPGRAAPDSGGGQYPTIHAGYPVRVAARTANLG